MMENNNEKLANLLNWRTCNVDFPPGIKAAFYLAKPDGRFWVSYYSGRESSGANFETREGCIRNLKFQQEQLRGLWNRLGTICNEIEEFLQVEENDGNDLIKNRNNP